MTDDILEIDLDAPESRRRRWLRPVILAGVLGLVVGGIAVLWSPDEADAPDDSADPFDEDPTGDTDTVTVRIESAGRADGIDSLRLPMLATPDDGLVDGQTIALAATGFGPNLTVAAVQCAGIAGSYGSENDCDVGNYVLHSTNDRGDIAFEMTVRRYISTSQGMVDCANPGDRQCVVAVANISDYDESATANVWFDPEVDGVRGPAVSVSRTDGVADGEIVTVTGSGFPAGAPVVVGQCIVGGSSSIIGCWDDQARLADVVADAEGNFTVDVAVSRVVAGGRDCVGNLYGCRITARATLTPFEHGDGTAANPVRLWFDGTTPPDEIDLGVAYSLNPDRELADVETIALAMGNLTRPDNCTTQEFSDPDGEEGYEVVQCEDVPIDSGAVVVAQCVDLAAGEEYCTEPVELSITNGRAAGEVVVQRFFIRDRGDAIDCAQPGRLCELRITGDVTGYVPLRFAGGE